MAKLSKSRFKVRSFWQFRPSSTILQFKAHAFRSFKKSPWSMLCIVSSQPPMWVPLTKTFGTVLCPVSSIRDVCRSEPSGTTLSSTIVALSRTPSFTAAVLTRAQKPHVVFEKISISSAAISSRTLSVASHEESPEKLRVGVIQGRWVFLVEEVCRETLWEVTPIISVLLDGKWRRLSAVRWQKFILVNSRVSRRNNPREFSDPTFDLSKIFHPFFSMKWRVLTYLHGKWD